jgi:hypothetical protein
MPSRSHLTGVPQLAILYIVLQASRLAQDSLASNVNPLPPRPLRLGISLGVLGLAQAVLLQQRIDLVRSPKVVVDLSLLGPSNGSEFDCNTLAEYSMNLKH